MTDEPKTYYGQATSWALDETAAAKSALRSSRVFGGGLLIIAILEAFALLLLMPLKSVSTLPVLVDRQTGYVEVLKPDGRRELTANAALTQSFLAQYVLAREGFDITAAAANYRKVALWSAGDARSQYLALMPVSNPKSPLRVLPRTAIVDTMIKSISPVGPNTALVRFETRRRDEDGRSDSAHAWAALVAYRFTDAPMSVEDRLVNPLGFQVVRYRRDPEVLTPLQSAEVAPPPTPTPAPTQTSAQPAAPVRAEAPQTIPAFLPPAYAHPGPPSGTTPAYPLGLVHTRP
jgi:type IV secretion system protein VirB8